MTVKNEADSLPRLFESLALQTKLPDEIIVADGGSTDDTVDLLRQAAPRYQLRVLECRDANISQGRNAAIRDTDAEVIASIDAGVRLDPHWFENISAPLLGEPTLPITAEAGSLAVKADRVSVVSGFFLPDPHGAFETALAAATLPELRDIQPDTFLPSSRSIAFRRTAWERVNGYPEWLDYCEDLIFDFDLRRAGMQFQFQPNALVYFRPRSTLGKFFKQYYLYARGDGKANLWWKRHLLRYLTYLIAIPISLLLLRIAPAVSILMWLVGAYALFGAPYRRLLRAWGKLSFAEKAMAFAFVPVVRVTGDIAKMIGYPVGIWWRIGRGRRATVN